MPDSGKSRSLCICYSPSVHSSHAAPSNAPVSMHLCITQPRESPIQGHGSGDESIGKLYEASGAWCNTAHRLGKTMEEEWIRAPK